MFDSMCEIRRFLNDCGFVQDPSKSESGTIYMYYIPASNSRFVIDLEKRNCDAYYPDFQYNKSNAYSQKESVVTFSWKATDDAELVIENLKSFFTKILTIIGKV